VERSLRIEERWARDARFAGRSALAAHAT
jgi:hypothetical protein